jgi:thioesterase domain-containing protein
MRLPRSSSPTPAEVQSYLHQHIPISSAMGVRVLVATRAGITLGAPLAPNINHRATVFGGSVSAVAILAAWAWLHWALRDAGLTARLVIQRNTVEYLAPVAGDFEARCAGVSEAAFEKFEQQFRRLGKARVTLAAELIFEQKVAAEFEGDYVAMRLD